MKKKTKFSVVVLSSFLIFIGCKKDEAPVAPVISIENISEYSITEYNNAIVVTIQYEDHQGDIGTTDPDEHSLFITDERFVEQDGYHIDPLTPNLQALHVRGTFQVTLRPLFIMQNDSIETTHLTFELRDRASHTSNQVTSDEITIARD